MADPYVVAFSKAARVPVDKLTAGGVPHAVQQALEWTKAQHAEAEAATTPARALPPHLAGACTAGL